MWLLLVGDVHMFLPKMSRSYGLCYLQLASAPRDMSWPLFLRLKGVTLSKFLHSGDAITVGGRGLNCLHPSVVTQEYPEGENPQ